MLSAVLMDTSGGLYMVSAPISRTTQSKCFLLASCKGGAPSLFLFLRLFSPCLWLTRCTAKPEDLEGPSILRRCEHTEMIVDAFELGDLWYDYGVVGDIVVSISVYFCSVSTH